jgi:hypothetical protein
LILNRSSHAKGTRKARNLLFAILGLTLAGIAWTAMAWLTLQFQAMRCPVGTFFWASNQVPTALQVVPLCFSAIGISFWAANWIVGKIPGGRAFFNPKRKPRADDAEQRMLIKFTLGSLLLILPISLSASLCQFCLQPHAITYQSYPWTGFREYVWQDVSSVTTACRYSRGRNAGWRKQFILGMKDGATFDLMTWPAAAVRAFPEIAKALRGGDFSFDESGVAPRCPQPYMGMLSHRP